MTKIIETTKYILIPCVPFLVSCVGCYISSFVAKKMSMKKSTCISDLNKKNTSKRGMGYVNNDFSSKQIICKI